MSELFNGKSRKYSIIGETCPSVSIKGIESKMYEI